MATATHQKEPQNNAKWDFFYSTLHDDKYSFKQKHAPQLSIIKLCIQIHPEHQNIAT